MSHTVAYEDVSGSVIEYRVSDLWGVSKDLPTSSVPLAPLVQRINGYINSFNSDDWERVSLADMSYPIIVRNIDIMDGCHRVVKAMLLGHTSIDAKVLTELPSPSRIWSTWDDYVKGE